MKERCKLINNTTMAPLAIYPEGTTGNGQYLLTFKKGAFCLNQPLKIICMKYSSNMYKPYNSHENDFLNQFLLMCSWWCSVEVFEFEGLYDPKHLGLDFENDEEAWKVFAARVRRIMSKCLQIDEVESGIRDQRAMMKQYEDTLELVRRGKLKLD